MHAFFSGLPCIQGRLECFLSIDILNEIREVLQRPKFGFSSEQALILEEELYSMSRIVTPKQKLNVIREDPDDNNILECAAAARAHIIVSRDSHLLKLKEWEGIRILQAAEVIKEINS